jgi:hypothetical protein
MQENASHPSGKQLMTSLFQNGLSCNTKLIISFGIELILNPEDFFRAGKLAGKTRVQNKAAGEVIPFRRLFDSAV